MGGVLRRRSSWNQMGTSTEYPTLDSDTPAPDMKLDLAISPRFWHRRRPLMKSAGSAPTGSCASSEPDAGLVHLRPLQALRKLGVADTKVTPQGLAEFKKIRPKVKIEHGALP
jgi:hypothetical protein